MVLEEPNVIIAISIISAILAYLLQISFMSLLWVTWVQLLLFFVLSIMAVRKMTEKIATTDETKKKIENASKVLLLVEFLLVFAPIAIALFFFSNLFWSAPSQLGVDPLLQINLLHIAILSLMLSFQSVLWWASYWKRLQFRYQPNMNPRKEAGRILENPIVQTFRFYGGIFCTIFAILFIVPLLPQLQRYFSSIFFGYLLVFDFGSYWRNRKHLKN